MIYSILIKLNKFLFRNILTDKFISKNPFKNLIYYLAGKNLKKVSNSCKSLDEYINLSQTYKYSLVKHFLPTIYLESHQNKNEILKFSKLVLKNRPKIVVEIGTARGGTFFLLSRISKRDSLLISIDLPIQPLGGIVSKPKIFYKSFSLDNQKIFLIRKNSHKRSTLKRVEEILNGKKIDLLFIDGDHTYNGVKQDFQMYAPLVKENGMIVFHDIVEVPLQEYVQVNKFWNELKKDYKHIEIVENWDQGRYGIGVIFNK